MSLSIGIIGLPNVGKSTLFNALLKKHQAKVANYPFTTIEPNVGIVEVPDSRLQLTADRLQLEKIIPATIKFIDIAGLVKNAHKGEGLGNQFLSHIREVDAVIHVLDGFSKDANPEEAKETVNVELELADIKKPMIYVLNVKEEDISPSLNPKSEILNLPCRQAGPKQIQNQNDQNSKIIPISAKFEADLVELPEEEQKEFLKSYNLKESGLIRLIKESYKLLNLITFYTLILPSSVSGSRSASQIQAWPILRDTPAPEAAAKVHTDMARGFIAAEVCSYEDLISAGSWQAAHQKGKIRTEGKEYQIQDGDIILFRFNV